MISIVMPCLNEAETLGICIAKAKAWLVASGNVGEVIVADNGSTDGSQAIAKRDGAVLVHVPEKGYGSALYHGAMAARGAFIIMGDSDDSYDFSHLDSFVAALRAGDDLVMGNRFRGGIAPGAMPWKNRYIGNPALSFLGRRLFRSPVTDFHCGLRACRKDAFLRMDLRTTGMEFASEMVIKATMLQMRISEVPTVLAPDGRSRPPHLRPWRDGWRHLRFMLLFSPRWLFLYPGMVLLLLSGILYSCILYGPLQLGKVILDIHTLFFAQAGILFGLTAIAFGVACRIFGMQAGLLSQHTLLNRMVNSPALEIGSIAGIVSLLVGCILGWQLVLRWEAEDFGPLAFGQLLRGVSVSTLLISSGGLVLCFSLIIGFLSLPMRRTGGTVLIEDEGPLGLDR